ncbi:hypothetical protein JCM17961_28910 [Endothiovibrio diazotrophicus]
MGTSRIFTRAITRVITAAATTSNEANRRWVSGWERSIRLPGRGDEKAPFYPTTEDMGERLSRLAEE